MGENNGTMYLKIWLLVLTLLRISESVFGNMIFAIGTILDSNISNGVNLRELYLELSIIPLSLLLLFVVAIGALLLMQKYNCKNCKPKLLTIVIAILYLLINILVYCVLYSTGIIYFHSLIPQIESSLIIFLAAVRNMQK